MTETSLFPQAAAAAGLDLGRSGRALVDRAVRAGLTVRSGLRPVS